MPYNRVSAMGVERGLVSPEEQFNAQRADSMRRAQMAALMAGGGQAGPSAGAQAPDPLAAKEPQIIGNTGTPYAPIDMLNRQVGAAKDLQTLEGQQQMDLSKESTNRAFGTTDRQMAPRNIEAQIGREKFDLEKPGLQSDADLNSFINGKMMDVLKGGAAQPAGGANDASGGGLEYLLKIMAARQGRAVMPSYEEDARKQVLNLDLEAKKREAEAAKGNVSATTPIEEYLGSNPGLTGQLGSMSKDFADRDTSVIGWNPTETDIGQLMNEMSRVQQLLVGKGYDAESAKREAMRIITNNLGSDQNDVNAGWISKLKQRLGIM